MKRISLVVALVALTSLALVPVASSAQLALKAIPFESVCIGGTDTVKAAWITDLGLPDGGNADHSLILLKAFGTSNCASAGANIQGVNGTLTKLGYYFLADNTQDDTYVPHCTAWAQGLGAPRFEVTMDDGSLHRIPCASGPSNPDSPILWWHGNPWYGKLWKADDFLDPSITYPPITGGTVAKIDIILDEGWDLGSGVIFLDNIDINGVLIGKQGLAK